MTEEPRLDKAFRTLLEALDKGIGPALAVTRRDQLVSEFVSELDSLLVKPAPVAITEARKLARTKLEEALRYWLEVNDYDSN